MSGIFKKVMCSDRLPEKAGKYVTNIGVFDYSGPIIIPNGNPATDYIERENGVWGHQTQPNLMAMCFPIWWLEEIELPSEENKQAIVKEWYKDQQFKSNYPAQPSSFMAGFNKAIKLIKGDK